MTSILLDCPECGADADARVHVLDDAEGALELLEYLCSEGCEGTVTVELWVGERGDASVDELGEASAAAERRSLVRNVA